MRLVQSAGWCLSKLSLANQRNKQYLSLLIPARRKIRGDNFEKPTILEICVLFAPNPLNKGVVAYTYFPISSLYNKQDFNMKDIGRFLILATFLFFFWAITTSLQAQNLSQAQNPTLDFNCASVTDVTQSECQLDQPHQLAADDYRCKLVWRNSIRRAHHQVKTY